MKTVAEEILANLPAMMGEYPNGPNGEQVAKYLAVAYPLAVKAMRELKETERAILVRYPGSKARHVVPLGHRFAKIRTDNRHRVVVCAWCDTLFQNGSKKFCSKTCFAQHMWSKPERRVKGSAAAKRVAKMPAGRARTEKLVALQRSPEGRARLSERNRRDWADPVHKAVRSANLQAAIGRPENRRHMSDMKRRQWEEPGFREKASAKMRETRSDPEVKKRYSEASKRRWQDPAYQEKMKVAAIATAERSRGRKRSPEEIAKQIETRRRNTEARGYYRHPNEKSRPRDLEKRRRAEKARNA